MNNQETQGTTQDVGRSGPTPCYQDDWRKRCRIIPDYMPPHPSPTTTPSIQVEYQDGDNGCGGGLFLRWFEKSDSFVWDVYGTRFDSVEQARELLARAPSPVGVKVYASFTIPLS